MIEFNMKDIYLIEEWKRDRNNEEIQSVQKWSEYFCSTKSIAQILSIYLGLREISRLNNRQLLISIGRSLISRISFCRVCRVTISLNLANHFSNPLIRSIVNSSISHRQKREVLSKTHIVHHIKLGFC
jgi:hypothetical protein